MPDSKMNRLMKKGLAWLVRIGMDPDDDDEIRLQKSLLTVCAFPFAFAGVAWAVTYILLGEVLAGIIPLSYAVISLFSIIHFGLTRRYHFFRFSQLTLILLLPFLLMMALGGSLFSAVFCNPLWALPILCLPGRSFSFLSSILSQLARSFS